jgi:uncharacterized membrane protein HdeD (DUF308 family)
MTAQPLSSSATEIKVARRSLGWGVALGILLALLGVVAIARPLVAGIAAAMVFGWVLLLAGVTQVVHAVRSRHSGHFWADLVAGLVHGVAGGLLLFYPLGGLLTLTLVVGVAILADGLLQTFISLRARPAPGWGLLLLSGVLGIVLGALIWVQWPSDALWLVGTLIGVKLIFRGLALATFTGFVRSALPRPTA